MEYRHKSGAQKRKEKLIREKESRKGQKSLTQIGFVVREKDEELNASAINSENLQRIEKQLPLDIDKNVTRVVSTI